MKLTLRAAKLSHIDESRMLDHIDFGAMVCGNLTQYALWLEDTVRDNRKLLLSSL